MTTESLYILTKTPNVLIFHQEDNKILQVEESKLADQNDITIKGQGRLQNP